MWTWITKDSPNTGNSFQVPTIPITCDKAAPKAICWMAAVFHSYKAHLNPIAIDKDSGRVKQGWLRLYQNNMYVHLQGQLKTCTSPKQVLPPSTKPTPPTQHPNPDQVSPSTVNPLENMLAELQKELCELQEKFTNYILSHKACCMHGNHQSSESSSSEDGHNDKVPPRSPPLPHLYITDHDGSSVPDPNPPTWLVTTLTNPSIPPIFQRDVFSPDP
ncbi:hypothetical protein EDC04DRAFT_2610429 [Pisolithus marmoratus]|nr:hypothetical protein EDC04DRAFT_2610429 [Pisolithus marmoratus]